MFGVITVGVDGSAHAAAAVDWAAEDAARAGAVLRIVHVREPWAGEYPFHRMEGFNESLTDYCAGVLDAAAGRAREHVPGLEVSTALITGAVVERLRHESENADTLVLGSRGMGGFTGLVLGSVGLALAGHAAGPVVIVRDVRPASYRKVVVGVDGSPHSEAALGFAFEQASARGWQVEAVHSWPMPALSPVAAGYTDIMSDVSEAGTRGMRQWLAPWRDKFPDVPVTETGICGHPVPALGEASQTADLLVVGSRGLGGFTAALLGSVGHGVLHHAHCPVAVVRPRPA
ncbi:universal stress protein [Sphaerisporangium rufum]|uniref:Universal stress protein n=1 Tax=Sphaerisporangium rufum TaxID=1381558 RepID=A0A919QZ82_9ACTN|nr:universal stress protein [Sphaerisporangium rufum]GII76712.1 universal stress protein [Sphaerisporangium rufum]